MSPESGQSPASYSPGSITPPYKSLGGGSHSDMMEQISAKVNFFVLCMYRNAIHLWEDILILENKEYDF